MKVLDGLRALAIAMVVLFHVSMTLHFGFRRFPVVFGNIFLSRLIMNCWLGVDLFFVLSGFLIAGQLVAMLPSSSNYRAILKAYFMRRFLRIAPAYYLILTAITFGIYKKTPLGMSHAGYWLWGYICHLLFIHDFFGPDIDKYFWSLATEAKFYLLAPLIVMALMRLDQRNRYAFIGLVMLILLSIKIMMFWLSPARTIEMFFYKVRIPFYSALDGLFAGVASHFLWRDETIRTWLQKPFRADSLFWGSLILLLLLLGFMIPYCDFNDKGLNFFSETLLFPVVAVLYSMILLGLLSGCRGHRFFEIRILKGLALISYSLYLIHPIVLKYSLFWVFRWAGDDSHVTEMWLMEFLLIVWVAVPLAALSYYFVERPFIRWAHARYKLARQAHNTAA